MRWAHGNRPKPPYLLMACVWGIPSAMRLAQGRRIQRTGQCKLALVWGVVLFLSRPDSGIALDPTWVGLAARPNQKNPGVVFGSWPVGWGSRHGRIGEKPGVILGGWVLGGLAARAN
jgi:hypothetical protein